MKTVKTLKRSLSLLTLLILSAALIGGCASTNFQAYEGTNSIVHGRGGAKDTVDGVDIWTHGDPPRTFKVLGFIEDERADDWASMPGLKRGVAQKAREQGGDAVILVSSNSQLTGYLTIASASAYGYGNYASASGSATTIPLKRRNSTFVVIKYLG